MILLVGNVSALELKDIDDVKVYDENLKTYSLDNFFGYGKHISDLELKTPQNFKVTRGYQKIAEIEIRNGEYDYENIINGMKLYNIKDGMKELVRNVDYKYKTIIQVPEYKTICDEGFSVNGTAINTNCRQEQIGLKDEVEWKDFTRNSLLKGENLTLGIFTEVKKGDRIEWVINVYGNEKLIAWARWEESWNVGLELYYKLDESSGAVIDSIGTYNGTNNGATTGVDGIINTAYDFESTENDYINITPNGIDMTQYLSINVWVILEDLSSLVVIVSPTVSGGWTFQVQSAGSVAFGKWGIDGVDTLTTYNLSISELYMLTLVYNTTGANFFVNGTLVQTSAYSTVFSDQDYYIGQGVSGAVPFDGVMDEISVWNRSLTNTEVINLFDAQKDGFISGQYTTVFGEITLNSPIDNFNSSSQTINFNGTVTFPDGITNNSLIIDGILNETNSSGINDTDYLFTKTFTDGNYNWTYEACSSSSDCITAITRNFTIDTIFPQINITYPIGTIDFHEINTNLSLNWTVSDLNLDSCWYDWNGTNVSVTCLDNQTNINITDGTNVNLILWVNDTSGNTNSSFTSWDYLAFQNSITFNSITYETAYETYLLQIISKSGVTPSNGRFNYGGTEYTATITPTGGNNYNISGRSQDIPTVGGATDNSFNFTWTSDSSDIGTSNYNQTVYPISFSMTLTSCDAGSLNYLNFTFKDEADDADLNASNDLTDVNYWLGSGTVSKSLITSNTTDNDYYVFCLEPQNRTLTLDMVFKYSRSGYPIRTFAYDGDSFTNETTNQTLYLLATADGIYSSFNIINSVGNPIQGVKVIIERQFSGVWTVIGQDTTGSDGSVTFWVNPNFQHRITAEKTGYTTGIVTITPTQSTYTMTLASSLEEGGYISELPGLKWVVLPAIGTIPSGNNNFNATVTSTESNLENCKFELLNSTNSSQVLAITTDITNSSYCYLTITYGATENNNLFGRLSIDTDNTTGFVVVDSDWKWIVQDIENKEWRSIGSFFGDLRTIGEFGEGNEAEFSRIVFFFILITIFVGVFNYFTGVEFTNPGISLIVIWVIVLIASASGFLTFDSGSSNVNDRIEQWGFFFILTLMVGGFILSTMRRAQE